MQLLGFISDIFPASDGFEMAQLDLICSCPPKACNLEVASAQGPEGHLLAKKPRH